jgi:O-acetyl-ADP-ribose deacetylase (regulator of RNase III)
MITFEVGNLLLSDAQALVNTVNTEGVMGKGIAFSLKRNFRIIIQFIVRLVNQRISMLEKF